MLFQCGKHDSAISRVDGLIDVVDVKSLYITVRVRIWRNFDMQEG